MQENNYTIKAVVNKTGLSAHVIRVWEKRYDAVSPLRSESNRRLYSEADVERLKLLHEATRVGHSIGTIANLPTETLVEMIGSEPIPRREAVEVGTVESGRNVQFFLDACIGAIQRLDSRSLEDSLKQAAVTTSYPVILDQVVIPLIQKVGDFWEEGTLKVANEHLASNVIKTFLNNLRSNMKVVDSAPRMVVTTPVGQMHELGALVAAANAAALGWDVIYLGPNLPADEIAGAVKKNQAGLLCLSIVYPGQDELLSLELAKLGQLLNGDCKIIAGGRAVQSYTAQLEKLGAAIITDMVTFRKNLSTTGA